MLLGTWDRFVSDQVCFMAYKVKVTYVVIFIFCPLSCFLATFSPGKKS